MKTKVLFVTGILILAGWLIAASEVSEKGAAPATGQTVISCSPELQALAGAWADAYQVSNPGVKIGIRVISATDNIWSEGTSLLLAPDERLQAVSPEGAWKMTVGRNALVPFVSTSNPALEEILGKGISKESLAGVMDSDGKPTWGRLLGNASSAALSVYAVKGDHAAMILARYLKISPDRLTITEVESSEALFAALKNDPNALGFSPAIQAVDRDTRSFAGGIRILPLDRNGNGRLDHFEDIYADWNSFLRGVWIGKYPVELCSDIAFMAPAKPVSDNDLGFLRYVLTAGQDLLGSYGFSDMTYSYRQAQLERLGNSALAEIPVNEKPAANRAVILILGLIVAGSLAILLTGLLRRKKTKVNVSSYTAKPILDASSINIPKGLYFDRSHTWSFMEKNGQVRIGIDDFLSHVVGPVTRIKFRKTGDTVKKGEYIFTLIQEGKQINITSPVSGRIIAVNEQLSSDTSVLSTAPFQEGWICEIEPVNWLSEIQLLRMADQYKTWVRCELNRFRDFLAMSLGNKQDDLAMAVLQDGGEIRDGVLSDLGPETWDDFQTQFLETAK